MAMKSAECVIYLQIIEVQITEVPFHFFFIFQESLSSTRENPGMGETILKQLCPALVTVVTDGVKPAARSLFGKVKNTPWRLVEELVEQGMVKPL